jgi:hypothetical protein
VIHQGTSARGHFAGTPTRSLHARGAGAPGDTSGCLITRFAARGPLPPPTARCPSPRPPARGWAMRAVRRALASMIGARPVGGWRTIFVPVTQERRRAPLRRDVDAQPARPRRRCAGRYFRLPRLGGRTRFSPAAVPAPAARGPSRDRRRAGGDAGGVEALASMIGAGRSVRAATSPRRRRVACTPVAQLRRGDTSGCPRWVA